MAILIPTHPFADARRASIGALAVLFAAPSLARAGMPSVTLTEIAQMRMEAISFFLVVLLASAWIVQRIWNGLRGDFASPLPYLSYKRALGVIALWGLLFGLILTMISGARELMTPGAWTKQGLTYKLTQPPVPLATEPDESERRRALEGLRAALWNYAGTHGGQFPPDRDDPGIPADLWLVPDRSMRYVYVAGHQANDGDAPIVIEPELFGPDPMALTARGAIRRFTRAELLAALPAPMETTTETSP